MGAGISQAKKVIVIGAGMPKVTVSVQLDSAKVTGSTNESSNTRRADEVRRAFSCLPAGSA